MGEIIRKSAAVADILEDVDTTRTNAKERGGIWLTEAKVNLDPIASQCERADQKLTDANKKLDTATSHRQLVSRRVALIVLRIHDVLYNDLDRPQYDPQLDLMFPGGTAPYTDAPLTDRPIQIRLLAGL